MNAWDADYCDWLSQASVSLSATQLCCANTAGWIKVLFGLETLEDPGNIVLYGSPDFLHPSVPKSLQTLVSCVTCSSNETTLGCTLSRVKWATSLPTTSGNDEKYEQNSVSICRDITRLTFSFATETSITRRNLVSTVSSHNVQRPTRGPTVVWVTPVTRVSRLYSWHALSTASRHSVGSC